MNIQYTQELQNSITVSNDEFIKQEHELDRQKAAAKLSLYYAHGNTEKNEYNLRSSTMLKNDTGSLNRNAVNAVNMATKALAAAKQSLIDAGKATSNASVAATNVQIAANAITRLSSDVAGIYAVASAADFGSNIMESIQDANTQIASAAKQAEELSLVSLNATIEAARSTASTVVTDAELALASVTNFQKGTSAQYSDASQRVVAATESTTAARKVEKAASGRYEVAYKQDLAIKSTRSLINEVSNHDLLLFDPVLDPLPKRKRELFTEIILPTPPSPKVDAGQSYTIQFRAFQEEQNIQAYRLIMVRYEAAEAFDLNMASDLDPGTYYKLKVPKEKQQSTQGTKEKQGIHTYSRTFYLLGTDQALIPYDPVTFNLGYYTEGGVQYNSQG